MHRTARRVDIGSSAELSVLVDEVRRSGAPCILSCESEDVAILMPVFTDGRRHARQRRTAEDYAAFRAAFGGWKGIVDTDTLKERIAADRGSDRGPVEP